MELPRKVPSLVLAPYANNAWVQKTKVGYTRDGAIREIEAAGKNVKLFKKVTKYLHFEISNSHFRKFLCGREHQKNKIHSKVYE